MTRRRGEHLLINMFNHYFKGKCEKIIGRYMQGTTSSPTGTDHLQRTAHSTRIEMMSSATIVKISDESSTVKCLELKISDPKFKFKAGQWVDTHIPGVEKVGGFSMCSSPSLLQKEGIIQLAVKNSTQPPAQWVHSQCSVGDKVDLRVGGDYFYDPQPGDPPHNLLLLAGGVGINPLMSMLNQIHDLLQTYTPSSASCPRNVILLFSAKTLDEIIFKERIEELCNSKYDCISAKFFITNEHLETSDQVCCGRIGEEHIKASVEKLQKEKLLCYLCGPSPMIHSIETTLHKCGVDKSCIHYEKWW